ncbi:YigZ family protein [Anaerosporobacter faecicola]|uniref:YigZ family protein n=1 Tax=Anaerosporobacter faecicola TaxID=2718714 RepID=UPI00143CB47A|nr:YigZ family protein [Anaerosporobacter faecicola]
MIDSYKAVYTAGESEIIEKKSRFIATVEPICSEEEAIAMIEKMRKKHWDATHNCFAYVVGERNEVQRCSDDGEPSGTAGKPMLDVLLAQGIHNVVVVVTRYFGGTLLGTGGLVRAYTKATVEGLVASVVIEKKAGKRIRIVTDYNGVGKLQYITCQMQITVLDTSYTDSVTMDLLVTKDQITKLQEEVTEATSGKCKLEFLESRYFAQVGQEVLLFDEILDEE